LAEPLVRTAPTTPDEDGALANAVTAYSRRASPDDYSTLTAFAARFPRSGWTPAVETNLGLTYLHDGYFSRAIDAWRAAWTGGRNATDPHAKAMIDRAVGELARLYANLGQFNNLTTLLAEMGKRPVSGSATEAIQDAREELTLVTKDPRHLFNCGPVALKLLMLALDPGDQSGASLQFYRAGPRGTNLAEIGGLAANARFPYRIVFRKPGQAVPIPSLVHWKVGHYSAITRMANWRYRVEDPAFPGSGLWVTEAALDSEASGYFLAPAKAQKLAGWRSVGLKEAARVWGKGPTFGTQTGDPNDPRAHGGRGNGRPGSGGPGGLPGASGQPGQPGQPGCPMCSYDIKESTVGITLSDTPVGYAPPIGPSANVTIAYNQREDSQPANFSFFNVSPKWTLDWLTYIVDDPTNRGARSCRQSA
jgi:hypothetical protein